MLALLENRDTNNAATARVLCRDERFQRFLTTKGMPSMGESAAQACVLSLTGAASLDLLDTYLDLSNGWLALYREYRDSPHFSQAMEGK